MKNRCKLFKDKAFNEIMDRDGLVILPGQVIGNDEINFFSSLFVELHPNKKIQTNSFYSTVLSPAEAKQRINDEVKKVLVPIMDKVIEGYKAPSFTMNIKSPGENSMLDLHQDWSIVDENEFSSYNFWVPLINTNLENGTICFLLGSHRMKLEYRAPTIPIQYRLIIDYIKSKCTPVNVKAGQCVIFDQSILHFSGPNRSDIPRMSLHTFFTEKAAQFYRYYRNPELSDDNPISVYAMEDTFFLDFEDFSKDLMSEPKGKKVKEVPPISKKTMTKAEFDNLYNVVNRNQKGGKLRRLLNLISLQGKKREQ